MISPPGEIFMELLFIIPCILLILALIVLITTYICFRLAFYVPDRDPEKYGTDILPKGKIYEPFYENMKRWAKETSEMKSEEFCITSFDNLKLYGRYYEYESGAPIELMFHGYRGAAQRDLSGAVQRCFKLGHSALLVDQRASEKSEGNIISFGVNEHRDCHAWINFMIEHFESDVKIILCGISMGASTVLMATSKPLPENVIGVLTDCGYSDQKAIIKKVIKQMHLPAAAYVFVKLGARLFGHFDLEELTPLSALKNCKVPVIIFHGEADDFVPCEMSYEIYDACRSKKMLVTVPDAGHGLSYPIDHERYLAALREFF